MLYSHKFNACVFDTPDGAKIAAYLPAAKVLPGKIVVPCDMFNMQIMRLLGFSAMSPILLNYDWPGRHKPYTHQRVMAAFLTLHPRSFNLSDIGTGKTLGTLWAADYLMRLGLVKKALVLSPLSTLRRVWEDEIFSNFLTQRTCSILHGSRAERLARLKDDVDFYIINHDGLGVGSGHSHSGFDLGPVARAVRDRPDINLIIVDEGSVYKDGGTTRYKVLRRVVEEKPYIWWLTGTPTPNDPVNAWSQARIVNKKFTESQVSFRERTMYKVTNFKWKVKSEAPKIVAEALTPAIRIDRDECLDLPECITIDRDVEFTPAQKKAYDELKKTARVMVGAGKIDAVNEAVLRMKLIQICCGAVYDAKREVHKIDCAPRLSVAKEIIEQAHGKVIVFAPLTSVVNLLYYELSKEYSVEKVNGEVSASKRGEIFRAFQQEKEPRIIVADPRTMAHGLTLTEAATIIWYGPTDQSEVYTQANGRINRPGQKRKMLVARLSATALERGIYAERDGDQKMQNLVLALAKEGM